MGNPGRIAAQRHLAELVKQRRRGREQVMAQGRQRRRHHRVLTVRRLEIGQLRPVEFRERNTLHPLDLDGIGLEHRVGGIEKSHDSGHISYDAENHQKMTDIRMAKIAGIADDIPPQDVDQGGESGRIAVVGWGSTYGPISRAVTQVRADGEDVSHIHLRYINPLPRNLGDLLRNFEKVLVPEMNTGQLVTLLRSEYLVPAEGLNKVNGQPFKISEIEGAIRARLES